MMKNFFEEPDERYPDNKDEGLHANLACDSKDQRPIGRWGRMHGNYLKAMHPELYEHLILNGTLRGHLADADESAESMMERLIRQNCKYFSGNWVKINPLVRINSSRRGYDRKAPNDRFCRSVFDCFVERVYLK